MPVEVVPSECGVMVTVFNVYSKSIFVPNSKTGRLASALRAGESHALCDGIWVSKRKEGVYLSAVTPQTYYDGQYPSVFLTLDAAAQVAGLIDQNPLSGAQQRMNDNLRKVFG